MLVGIELRDVELAFGMLEVLGEFFVDRSEVLAVYYRQISIVRTQ